MRPAVWLFPAVVLASLAVGDVSAERSADTADGVDELKSKMSFFTTGDGAYIAMAETDAGNHVFYGTGRDLYRQRVLITALDDEDDISVLIWAPNHPRDASLDSDGDSWVLRCGETKLPLSKVDTDEREVLLGTLRFHEQRFQRTPYALARNDRGEYFYVDRAAKSQGSEGFALHIGRTGKAKMQRLKWVVSDSEGDVFASKRGELRISKDDGESQISWKARGKRSSLSLLPVPIAQNAYLIYKQLGVYENRSFGTPCDSIDASAKPSSSR